MLTLTQKQKKSDNVRARPGLLNHLSQVGIRAAKKAVDKFNLDKKGKNKFHLSRNETDAVRNAIIGFRLSKDDAKRVHRQGNKLDKEIFTSVSIWLNPPIDTEDVEELVFKLVGGNRPKLSEVLRVTVINTLKELSLDGDGFPEVVHEDHPRMLDV